MIALLLVGAALAVSVGDVSDPRPSGSSVMDEAGVLPAASEGRINDAIRTIRADSGVEVVVVTVDSVSGSPKGFSTALFNRWELGDARDNDGLLLLLVMDERRLELETGIGLEGRLPAAWLEAMQHREMVPSFKAGDYGRGVEAGLTVVGDRLSAPVHAAPAAPAHAAASTSRRPMATKMIRTPQPKRIPERGLWVLGAAVSGGCLITGALVLTRYRVRHCEQCAGAMTRLEAGDAARYLSSGQQLEAKLGSVGWTVYSCGRCDHQQFWQHRRLLSTWVLCKRCGFRTARREREILQAATSHTGGRQRVTDTCHHCQHRHEDTRSTPRHASNHGVVGGGGGGSSFGGGGSRGGGSSSGGGAGSSW